MNKQQLLNDLFKPYKQCNLCPLGNLGRTQVVFGKGNPNATLMLIGEAPGKKEDIEGIPFVGPSGKLLIKILENLGIKTEDIYITNIVKCKPPKNRTPLFNEISICKKILLEKQIQIIAPQIICTLGKSALNALILSDFALSKVRGSFLLYKTIPLLPTFHPSYILRKQSELNKFAQDLELAYKKSQ